MSLRWKIALALAAIVSVATVAVGAANYRTTRDQLYDEVDRSLVTVDARLGERGVLPDGDALPERGPFAGFDAQVVRLDGVVAQTTLDVPLPIGAVEAGVIGDRGRTAYTTVSVDGTSYRVRTVGLQRGAFQTVRSLDEVDRVLRALRIRTLLWSVVVVAAAATAGLWIAGRVTASLRRLTVAAEHVEATGALDVAVGEAGDDEVGRLGAAFDRMLGALRSSRDDQQRLVQDAGHELRTPLTSLRTNLDVLARHPDLQAADRRAILADLQAEAQELTGLVNELVAVAAGSHTDEPYEPIDLVAIAEGVAARYRRRTGRAIEVVGGAVPVVGQRASLERAVSCLIDNACKFDTGGGPIGVEVSGATVTVTDRGPGIDPHELARVFDRFHRAESARSMSGSGLGLSIVRDVARRHGGEAFAANVAGGGARVGFRVSELPPPPA